MTKDVTDIITIPTGDATLRVLQITDTHIFPDPKGRLYGVNTWDTFQMVLEEVLRNREADFIIMSGDLTNFGEESAYHLLAAEMDKLGVPYFWMPGNHDLAEPLQRISKKYNAYCKAIVTDHWHFVLGDSHRDHEVNGFVDSNEIGFLRHQLAQHPDKSLALFLHHHLMPVGCAWLDLQKIGNADEVLSLLDTTPQLKLVVNGHVHQEWESEHRHYWMCSTPSTCAQFKTDSDDYALDDLSPGYRWFEFKPNGTFKTGVVRVTG